MRLGEVFSCRVSERNMFSLLLDRYSRNVATREWNGSVVRLSKAVKMEKELKRMHVWMLATHKNLEQLAGSLYFFLRRWLWVTNETECYCLFARSLLAAAFNASWNNVSSSWAVVYAAVQHGRCCWWFTASWLLVARLGSASTEHAAFNRPNAHTQMTWTVPNCVILSSEPSCSMFWNLKSNQILLNTPNELDWKLQPWKWHS